MEASERSVLSNLDAFQSNTTVSTYGLPQDMALISLAQRVVFPSASNNTRLKMAYIREMIL